MRNKHKKTINGYININVSMPLTYKINAWDEDYQDENGNLYTEEEYEYSVDDVLKYGEQTDKIKSINEDIEYLKSQGWRIELIELE